VPFLGSGDLRFPSWQTALSKRSDIGVWFHHLDVVFPLGCLRYGTFFCGFCVFFLGVFFFGGSGGGSWGLFGFLRFSEPVWLAAF